MADITEEAARRAAKPSNQYRVEEFTNQDGEKAAVLIDNESGSITLQANGGNPREKLQKAVEEGNLVFLDPAVPPEVDQEKVPEPVQLGDNPSGDEKAKANRVNQDIAATTRTNNDRRREAGLLRDGYVVLDDESKGVGRTGTSTATADKRSVGQSGEDSKKSSQTKSQQK